MTALAGHQTLRNRYRFTGRLELTSPLRLSSGRASDVTDAPLMRDRSGIVYIPGSSLRGVLRSELERILSGLELADGPRSCILFSEDDRADACVTVHRGKQEELSKKPEGEALAYLGENLCDLCRLFGSPVYASRLTIEDAYPEKPEGLPEKGNIRDGVGIDRDTGAAREGIKFNYEVLEKGKDGTFFTLRMQLENLDGDGAHDRTLLNLALALLEEGLNVGGKRAAGLGQIKLQKASIKVHGFKSTEDLWKDLQARVDPHRELKLEEVLNA
jgi:CRISPR-associated protein Csm3